MFSSISEPSSLALSQLQGEIQCPVSLEPLQTAVTLVPCSHKINENVAQVLFGSMSNDSVQHSKPCPVCRCPVKAYYPDHKLRNLVQMILNQEQDIKIFVFRKECAAAIEIAQFIPDIPLKSAALQHIVEKMVVFGDYALALSIAETISDEFSQSYIFRELSLALVHAGRITEALQITKKIVYKDDQSYVLLQISRKLIELGQIDTLIDLIKTVSRDKEYTIAVALAQSITDYHYPSTLRHISEIAASLGDFETALSIAETIPDEGEKTYAFIELSIAFANVKRLSEALHVASRISDENEHDYVFSEISQKLAQFRMFDEALDLAKKICYDRLRKAWTLSIISREMTKMKNIPEAIEVAEMISDGRAYGVAKSQAFSPIASLLADEGRFEEAYKIIIERVSEPTEKSWALLSIAIKMVDAGFLAMAQEAATAVSQVPGFESFEKRILEHISQRQK